MPIIHSAPEHKEARSGRDAAMATVASRVRIQQRGDATVGVREDYLVDERTGLMVKREQVVATVPVEGGGTATLVGEKTSAVHLQVVYSNCSIELLDKL